MSVDIYSEDSNSSALPARQTGLGFCFDCDKPVDVEYDQW